MSAFIANQSMVLTTDNLTAVATVITPPSTKVKASGGFIYLNNTTVQIVGATQGTYVQTVPVSGDLISTATKVKSESKFVLLEGDETAPIQTTLQNTVNPFDSIVIPIVVTIQSAGQVKAKAT